jgi:predicted membrane-bound dolichyl-phosphate-mannose-protein mannosyltransferase
VIGFPPDASERRRATATALYEKANTQADMAARGAGVALLVFLAWYIPISFILGLAWWVHPAAWLGLVWLCSALKQPARDTLKVADALAAEPTRAPKPPSLN